MGVFARACFTYHRFGHLASKCPTLLHQPPPTTLTQDTMPLMKQGAAPNAIGKSQDKNVKPQVHARNHAAGSKKTKDNGKAKIIENVHEEWQIVKKPFNLHSRPLQSCH